jgi:exosortase/archaeosortase family protein
MLGLQITLGCSSDLLLAPVVFATGVMLCLRNGPADAILCAALMASWTVVAVNVLRLVLIAALVDWWGVSAGFGWGHTLFGSLLTLAGMAAALWSFVTVLGRGKGARAV